MNLLVDGLSSQGKGTPAAQDWNSLIDLQEDQEILLFMSFFSLLQLNAFSLPQSLPSATF